MQKLRVVIEGTGKNAAGTRIPDAVVAALGSSRRPAVKATIGAYTWRSTIAAMGGEFWLGVSQENRAAAGVKAGDTVDLRLELDTEPREVEVPADLAAALATDAVARQAFEALSYSRKRWHVLSIDGAKTAETRERRIAKSIQMLREGTTP